MKFQISHARAFMGNDISVSIQSEQDETIARVQVQLDGITIGDDNLAAPSESYQRNFPKTAGAGPLNEHTLVVSATTTDGNAHSSTTIWVDAT